MSGFGTVVLIPGEIRAIAALRRAWIVASYLLSNRPGRIEEV